VLRIATHGRGIWEIAVPVPAGQLTNAVSRKQHTDAGSFDIDLPFTGTPGVECRTGGTAGDHAILFTFSNSLVSVSNASVTSGTGTVSSSGMGADPRQYIVNLTGVANAQNIVVTLNGVVDSTGAAPGPVSVTMGVLLGDTNADRSTNSGDTLQTRGRSGQVTNGGNFRSDVNIDGGINGGDTIIVRSASGTALTP
jgi:hypothetical protein